MIKKYKINSNRLSRAYKDGFEVTNSGGLALKDAETGVHRIYLRSFNSGADGCEWGRLTFNAAVGEETVYVVTAFASDDRESIWGYNVINIDEFLCDDEVSAGEKKRFFELNNAVTFSSNNDVLLYECTGRYLWLCLEVWGEDASFSEFNLYIPGDNFFQTFPEVYRKNGEFFHRYISVFSSLYNDLQYKIDNIDKLLDIDTAPKDFLIVFASWLGMELDGDLLNDNQLRTLLRNAFELNKFKGTRHAIEIIVGIFVTDPFYIIEHRTDPFSFTVLINRLPDEKLHARLLFLLNQFKPLRTKANIVFASDVGATDSGCYLDVNAAIVKMSPGKLDERCFLNGKTLLD
ncbi:MAG: phage tail protein [Oscillospiraceae bacterium]|nr:phage tail protein [Oscillospiraceae bacterium]